MDLSKLLELRATLDEDICVKVSEADSGKLGHRDLSDRLRSAVHDAHKGTGKNAFYQDHIGDDESGDVVYGSGSYYDGDGDTMMAPYSVAAGGDGDSAKTYSVDTDKAKKVLKRTHYEPQPDEEEHVAKMEESFKRDGIYTEIPLYERFVSKGERDKMSSEDFAGKGKSFPINQPGDIMAAVRSIGRAGSKNLGPSGLKSRIIAIAKRKGWGKYLPQSWQDGGADKGKESAPATASAGAGESIKVAESAGFVGEIHVAEASRANYPIKIISPGTGAMAHYPEKVIERDGPKLCKAGTLMFWDHATPTEEAEKPEGSLDKLAAIITKDAWYDKNGPKGPGLYAEARVMADFAQKVEERAPYIGLSIRAGGTKSGRTVDGKPELSALTYVESVDYVTRAGRGGMALAEAARSAGIEVREAAKKDDEENDMKCKECKGSGKCQKCGGTGKLQEAAKSKDCSDCKGSGDCPECDGEGKVEESMKPDQIKALVTEAVTAAVTPLKEALAAAKTDADALRVRESKLGARALKGDATSFAVKHMKNVQLPDAAKSRVLQESLQDIPTTAEGELDTTKLKEAIDGRLKEEGRYISEITGGDMVRGMGIAPALTDEQQKAHTEREKKVRESAVDVFTRITGDKGVGERAASKGLGKPVAA